MTYGRGYAHEMQDLANAKEDHVSPRRNGDSNHLDFDIVDSLKLHPITCQTKFYDTIFSIVSPFVYIGIPYNFCFPNRFKACHRIHDSWFFKSYTLTVLILVHLLLGFCIVQTAKEFFSLDKLTEHSFVQFFRLSYVFAGVISLDMIWCHRDSIKNLLSTEQLDYCPLDEIDKYKTLQAEDTTYLKYFRYKTIFLQIISRLSGVGLLGYLVYLVSVIVMAYTDSDPKGFDWSRVYELVTIYVIFFFTSNAIFLIVLIWTIKYKLLHLNLFVTNLTTLHIRPYISDIVIIKNWYKNIKKTASIVNSIFWFYLPIYIGIFFFGIIYFLSKIIDKLNTVKDVESLDFLILANFVLFFLVVTFYSLKELTDVCEYSACTRAILYEFVLNTEPESRPETHFFEEIQFVASGLLNNPIKFSIFGHIELTKSFMAHVAVVIYSYVVIFHQISQKFITTTRA